MMPSCSSWKSLATVLPLLAATPSLAQWVASSNGLPTTSGAVHAQNLIVRGGSNLYVASNTNLHRSTDDGANWTGIYAGLPANMRVNAVAATSTRLYVAFHISGSSPQTGGLYYSINGGDTWSNTGVSNEGMYEVVASGDTAVALDDAGNLHRTTNAGADWSASSVKAPNGSGQLALLNGVLYAFGDNGLHRSTDLGDAWTQVSTAGGKTLAGNGSVLYYGGLLQSLPQLYRSTDNGLAWAAYGTGYPAGGYDMRNLLVRDSVVLAAYWRGNAALGLYVSTDAGATWKTFNEGWGGAANIKTTGVVEKDGMLFSTTGAGFAVAGVYKRPLAETGGTTSLRTVAASRAGALQVTVAGGRRLYVATPGVSGPVTVRLRSLRGTVEGGAESFPDGALHGVTLDASALPAGVYAVTVTGKGLRASRTVVLR